MGKPKRERVLKETEARARTSMIRISSQKLNLVAQLIRGKKVATALADLTFSRSSRRSPMPRTTTTSTSTRWSSPRRMSGRR